MTVSCRLITAMVALSLIGGMANSQSVSNLRFSSSSLRFSVSDIRFLSSDLVSPVQKSATEQRFRLSGDVLFDFDKDAIQSEAEPVLVGLAKRIQAKFSGAPIRVEGHTDARGSASYNQDLSMRRANSVKEWFKAHGFPVPIQASGFGESQPVEPNQLPDGADNPMGRQQNRRVEIIVEKRGS